MSWGEVMVIGGVALIVIGPKELPRALRTLGQMTSKVRRMASEFQSQFSEAMREAELDDVRREVADLNRQVSSATAFNPIQTIREEFKGSTAPALPSGGEATSAATPFDDPVAPAISPPAIDPPPPDPVSNPIQPARDETGPGLEGEGEIRPAQPMALTSGTT